MNKNNLSCDVLMKKTSLNHFLLIMRTAIILLFTCVFISVAETGHSQNAKVSLNKNNVNLKEVLNEIENQTDYLFIYNNEVNTNKTVSVKTENRTVREVLNHVLRDSNIDFSMEGNHIILSYIEKQLNENDEENIETVQQKGKTITGTIVDAKGETIIGANIIEKGTSNGTITDFDGKFTLQVGDNAVLRISYIGYLEQEVSTEGKSSINITLMEDTKTLDEVVVVGYGTQRKENLTGAVSVVDQTKLASRPASNMSQLLQGAVPNMGVTFSSGMPGATGSFNIRGVNSISAGGGASPLVLIDGIEGSIDRINPQDVESVTVLKDASAAAVYGARASYGVIIVNTKSGDKEKTTVNYGGKYAINNPTVSTDYESRGYYSAGINDMFFETYQGARYTTYNEEDYHELWIRKDDKIENPDRPWVVEKDGQYKYYANTDWYDYLFKHSNPTQEHNLSISGGSKSLKYILSGNYYDQKGIFRNNPDRFKKYSYRSRISSEITSWLEISNTSSYFNSSYSYPGLGGVGNTFNSATGHALASFVPVNPDGTPTYLTTNNNGGEIMDGRSAILTHNKNRNNDNRYEFSTTFEATIKPIKQFELKTNYSYVHYNYQTVNRSVLVPYSKEPGVINTLPANRSDNRLSESQINHWYKVFNIYGTYSDTFNSNHNVSAMGGFNYETKFYKDLRMTQTGLLSDDLDDFNLAKGEEIEIKGGKNKYAIQGLFYRLNYDYAGKYLFETSARYDGSSRFKRGSRFAFFPSFSAGWRVSEEKFFTPLRNVVDNMKVRFSYGSLGNQQVGFYDYIQEIITSNTLNYTFNDGFKAPYAYESALNSDNLTWETVTTKNIGLDLGFLNNRLNAEMDYYYRDTKDMLMPGRQLPASYGISSPLENAADLTTKGWEVSLSWRDRFTLFNKTLNYSIGVGLGDNTSKVTRYDNPEQILGSNRFYEGQKLGQIWGYVVNGYFKSDEEAKNYKVDQSYVNDIINVSYMDKGVHAGDLKFEDLDGDNIIKPTTSALDIKDQKVIGNSLPRYNYNANVNLNWNGIDLSVFVQGIGKQNWYPDPNSMAFWGPYARPYATFIPSDFLSNIWSEDNPNAYFPRPRGYIALNASRRSLGVANTKYLQDLAYCRIKNITVGYSLNKEWISRAKLEKVRFYFSGENLFTFTKLENDYIDPEQASASNSYNHGSSNAKTYPWSKTISFGIDFTF